MPLKLVPLKLVPLKLVPLKRRVGLAAVVLLWGAAVTAGAGRAGAHALLQDSTPADGQRIAGAPTQVVLHFDEPATEIGTVVVVTGPPGTVSVGEPRLAAATVTQPLAAALPSGSYTVRWRVTTADGHPVSGTFGFTVVPGATSTPAPSGTQAGASPSTAAVGGVAPARQGRLGWVFALVALVIAGAAVAPMVLVRRQLRPPPDEQ